jgi:hypothetical protein
VGFPILTLSVGEWDLGFIHIFWHWGDLGISRPASRVGIRFLLERSDLLSHVTISRHSRWNAHQSSPQNKSRVALSHLAFVARVLPSIE